MEFPTIYYINCEHRSDRKQHLESELNKLRTLVPALKVLCVNATYIPHNGALGCGLSHIRALEMAMTAGDEMAIILEDDFTFRDGGSVDLKDKIELLSTGLIDWNVCLLAGNLKEHLEMPEIGLFQIVKKAYTTTGYIIQRNYIPRLIKTFSNACEGLVRSGSQVHEYCIDTAWQQLQGTDEDKWICMWPLVGYQYPNYSDIEKRETDYRALMCTF